MNNKSNNDNDEIDLEDEGEEEEEEGVIEDSTIEQSKLIINLTATTTISPPKRAKSTFPFGKCKICNDKATGVHYGVASCEGCKGFFKRMTLRKQKYRCFFGNNCPLMPDNRNRCKACRFRRCLESGMSIDGESFIFILKIKPNYSH
jgi:hypothetical protein